MKVYLETFGCQMNELDSELVRGHLQSLGYSFTTDPNAAEVVLYNTCSVREQAESKAYSRIGIVGKRKAAGERVILGVLGCMAERDGLDMLYLQRTHGDFVYLNDPVGARRPFVNPVKEAVLRWRS